MNTNLYNIPTQKSSDAEWISWHTAIKGYLGRKAAADLFSKAWAKNSSWAANTEALRDYGGKNKLTIDAGILGSVVDLGGDVTDYIGDFFMLGKYAAIGIVVIVVAGLGMVVFNLAKHPAESIGTIAKVAVL